MIEDDQQADAGAEEADRLADYPRDAKPWLDMIQEGKDAFAVYNDKCDSIDKLYAHLEEMSKVKADREFQIFWANLEVLKPSMYARPPIPVVVPRFKDQKELPRKVSEVLERTLATTFDLEDIDSTMRMIRDDLAVNARGVPWIRYSASGEYEDNFFEKICFDHVDRKDFLHGSARVWKEVPWVARRSFLTRKEVQTRFGDEVAIACQYAAPDDARKDGQSKEKKAQVWEIWAKDEDVVVWVSPNVPDVLDIQEPFLDFEKFFPCPQPAYGTVQRGSLIPVPDFLYYRDQIEEINELTARISALCESLRLKGFYAQGEESISDAIEKAIKSQDNTAILVPVPSFALAGGSLKDQIVWLPVDMVASVVHECVGLRKQLIEDVYQITGLSDIMRGATEASETATAQRIKQQYGSIRIRDRQNELIRIARDLTRMAAEVIAENFQPQTLLAMSQVDMPSAMDAMQPQMPPMMGQGPGGMQPPMPGAMPPQQPGPPPITIEAVVQMLRDSRVRPFILDIETDSTIQPDEDAEKQRANEFIQAMGGYMHQMMPLAQAMPPAIPLVGEGLKFVASKFRAGREMMGTIEKFVEDMKKMASQPKPPPPETVKMQAEAQKTQVEGQIAQQKGQIDIQLSQADLALKTMDLDIKRIEAQAKGVESQAKGGLAQAKMMEAQAKAMQPADQQSEEDKELIRAQIAKTYAEAEQVRSVTLMDPIIEAQALDHAERQMQLAEMQDPNEQGAE